MSLLMAALRMGRRHSNSRMTETVVMGPAEDDVDNDGSPIVVPGEPVYSGIGRVKYETLAVQEQDGAGSSVARQTPFLSIPAGSAVASEGDVVSVTASTVDESLVGRLYRVAGAPQAGQTTALRFPMEELS